MGKGERLRVSGEQFLVFTAQAAGDIEVRYVGDTIWLPQKLMARLFDVDVRTISEHLRNIFASGELAQESVIRKFRITAADGKSYLTQHYNLDAIISVGYRVNSVRATQYRQWATGVMRDFALRGYVLDPRRMENGNVLGTITKEIDERHALAQYQEFRVTQDRDYVSDFDRFAAAAQRALRAKGQADNEAH